MMTRSLTSSSTRLCSAAVIFAVVLVMVAPSKAQQIKDPELGEDAVLVDISSGVNLVFEHRNGMVGELYFPEMTGQGGALVDYDGDGDLDLYLVQGGSLSETGEDGDRLFRNDLQTDPDESRAWFVDVTEKSGIQATGYGMGVASGDFDGDGHVDLYVTNFGANELWRNLGDGTFEEVGPDAGVSGNAWSTSATFVDYDGDGYLDLYVANYVDWDLSKNPECYASDSRRDYCGPSGFSPMADNLYRNLRNGKFVDDAAKALSGYVPGPGLGVVAADFNGDGEQDIFVANDGERNQLWMGQTGDTLAERGLVQGVAVNLDGEAEASMGIAVTDFDRDGDEDLFVTHLMGETNTLYVNQGEGLFEDQTRERGLAEASLPFTSFGTGWLDLENDGWLDLFVASGSVKELSELRAADHPYPLGQSNQVYANRRGRFVSRTANEPALESANVSRGVATGDVDNDGDTDLVILNSNGPTRLLENSKGQNRSWLGATGTEMGSEIELVQTKDGERLRSWARARTDGSYCSSSDPRVRFGLGQDNEPQTLELRSRAAGVSRWVGLPAKTYYVVEQ